MVTQYSLIRKIGERICLDSTNSYREKHNETPKLAWDEELAAKAKAYAEHLLEKTLANYADPDVEEGKKVYMVHDPANKNVPKTGENIWYADGLEDEGLGFFCNAADRSW